MTTHQIYLVQVKQADFRGGAIRQFAYDSEAEAMKQARAELSQALQSESARDEHGATSEPLPPLGVDETLDAGNRRLEDHQEQIANDDEETGWVIVIPVPFIIPEFAKREAVSPQERAGTKRPWVYDVHYPSNVYSDDRTGSLVLTADIDSVPRPETQRIANAQLAYLAVTFYRPMIDALMPLAFDTGDIQTEEAKASRETDKLAGRTVINNLCFERMRISNAREAYVKAEVERMKDAMRKRVETPVYCAMLEELRRIATADSEDEGIKLAIEYGEGKINSAEYHKRRAELPR